MTGRMPHSRTSSHAEYLAGQELRETANYQFSRNERFSVAANRNSQIASIQPRICPAINTAGRRCAIKIVETFKHHSYIVHKATVDKSGLVLSMWGEQCHQID